MRALLITCIAACSLAADSKREAQLVDQIRSQSVEIRMLHDKLSAVTAQLAHTSITAAKTTAENGALKKSAQVASIRNQQVKSASDKLDATKQGVDSTGVKVEETKDVVDAIKDLADKAEKQGDRVEKKIDRATIITLGGMSVLLGCFMAATVYLDKRQRRRGA